MLTPEAQAWIETRMDAHDAYIIQNLRSAVTAARTDPAVVAKAVLAAVPPGSAGFTVAALAKAINDDAARRMVA